MHPTPEQRADLCEILKRFRLPDVLRQLFRFVPDRFVEMLVRFIFVGSMRRDPAWQVIANRQDKPFVVAVLKCIENLALSRWQVRHRVSAHLECVLMILRQPSPQYTVQFEASLNDLDGRRDDLSVCSFAGDSDSCSSWFQVLRQLVVSSNRDEWREGFLWLAALLRAGHTTALSVWFTCYGNSS